jgi:excisionase family DNA binding protein
MSDGIKNSCVNGTQASSGFDNPNQHLKPAFYTLKEAATVLRMSEKSVMRQIDRGNLRKCKTFGRILIPRRDVENFVEECSSFAV